MANTSRTEAGQSGAHWLQLVDERLLEGLRERGLQPQADGASQWQTGLPGLSLRRGETEAVGVQGRCYADVEVIASLDHPAFGRQLIQDRVSLDAESPEAVLAACVDQYLRMTFDPIRALFDEAVFARPTARLVSVVDPGEAISWNLYTAGLDLRGPDCSLVLEALGEGSMLSMVGSTLAGHLGRSKLHWFKIYGESQGVRRLSGCIFDGRHERGGEREMQAFLSHLPQPAHWAYRSFALFVPHGEPATDVVQELRAQLGPPPAPGPWWWPFRRQRRRVIWQVVECQE